MRCVICDASDVGLSYFNHDRPFAKHFHDTPSGPMCSECYDAGEEILDEWNFVESQEDEEESAFDYE